MRAQPPVSLPLSRRWFLAFVVLAQCLLSASLQAQELPQPEPIHVTQLRELFDTHASESTYKARARVSITTSDSLALEGVLKEALDSAVVLRNVRSATGKSDREKAIEYDKITDLSILSAKSIRRRDLAASLVGTAGAILGAIAAVGTGEDKMVFVLPSAGGLTGYFVGYRSIRTDRKRYVVVHETSPTARRRNGSLPRSQCLQYAGRHLANERETPEYLTRRSLNHEPTISPNR